MGIRSFLAFELPRDIKEQIRTVSEDFQRSTLPVRWVKVQNIHLTIVFLGSVDVELINGIKEKVDGAVEDHGAIRIRLHSVGAFPHFRRPRVLWVGLNGETQKLALMRDTLQAELKVLGFKPEKRPYRPHLTLGRFKGPAVNDEELKGILDKYDDITSDLYYLDELTLFKSDLKPGGPVYTKMASWPLGIG